MGYFRFRKGISVLPGVKVNLSKTGVSADVYEFAHRREAIYGILVIIIALLAGWGAGAIFRRA